MWKRMVCAALVLAGASHLPARADTSWEFEYKGFERIVDTTDEGFFPGVTLGGLFAGYDHDGNGIIDFSEVTRFSWDGAEYAKDALPHSGCPYDWCELQSFSYNIGTQTLQFSAAYEQVFPDDEGLSSGKVIGGEYYDRYSVGGVGSIGHDLMYAWTDQTRFTISPVPEPSGFAMSAAGLMLLLRLRPGKNFLLLHRESAGG